MRARHYDAISARFLSPDARVGSAPLESEPYVYANANPMMFNDPLGLWPWDGIVNAIGNGVKAVGDAIGNVFKPKKPAPKKPAPAPKPPKPVKLPVAPQLLGPPQLHGIDQNRSTQGLIAVNDYGRIRSTLIGMDGSTLRTYLIGLDGSTLLSVISVLIGNDGSTLIGLDSSTLRAKLIGLDGSTLRSLLIGNDGSTLRAYLLGNDSAGLAASAAASIRQAATAGFRPPNFYRTTPTPKAKNNKN
jgi:hypothetical protein